MFEKGVQEFQCSKGQRRNSNAGIKNDYQNRARIPMFERKGPEYQCFKEKGQNTNVGKRKVVKTNN